MWVRIADLYERCCLEKGRRESVSELALRGGGKKKKKSDAFLMLLFVVIMKTHNPSDNSLNQQT